MHDIEYHSGHNWIQLKNRGYLKYAIGKTTADEELLSFDKSLRNKDGCIYIYIYIYIYILTGTFLLPVVFLEDILSFVFRYYFAVGKLMALRRTH
jgi:hypothetical protein